MDNKVGDIGEGFLIFIMSGRLFSSLSSVVQNKEEWWLKDFLHWPPSCIFSRVGPLVLDRGRASTEGFPTFTAFLGLLCSMEVVVLGEGFFHSHYR